MEQAAITGLKNAPVFHQLKPIIDKLPRSELGIDALKLRRNSITADIDALQETSNGKSYMKARCYLCLTVTPVAYYQLSIKN